MDHLCQQCVRKQEEEDQASSHLADRQTGGVSKRRVSAELRVKEAEPTSYIKYDHQHMHSWPYCELSLAWGAAQHSYVPY